MFLFGLLVLLLILPTLSFYQSFPLQSLIRGAILFTAGFGIKKATQIFPSPSWSSIAALIAVLIIAVAIFKGFQKSYIFYPALLSLVYFTSFNNSASAALGFPFLTWLGERSYSIYILHHPLIVVFFRLVLYPNMEKGEYPLWVVSLTHLLIFVSTFVCAEISYRFFECPARDWIRKNLFPIWLWKLRLFPMFLVTPGRVVRSYGALQLLKLSAKGTKYRFACIQTLVNLHKYIIFKN